MDTQPDNFAGLPAIFRSACGVDGLRFNLTLPFVCADWVCATNGEILVRRPLASLPEILDVWKNGLLPADFSIREREGSSDPKYRRVPNILAVWPKEAHLGEAVSLPEVCADCRGTGKVTCNYGHEHLCPICSAETKPVAVGPELFRSDYVGLLRRSGVTELRLSKTKGALAYFAGEGFEGVVMPMQKSS